MYRINVCVRTAVNLICTLQIVLLFVGDVVVLKKNYMFVEGIFCITLFMVAAICF